MTLYNVSRWLWGFIDSIMSTNIPVMEYDVTLWNMFYYFTGGTLLIKLIMAKYQKE